MKQFEYLQRRLIKAKLERDSSPFFEGKRKEDIVPYMSYIGMCGPKGYGFLAVLV